MSRLLFIASCLCGISLSLQAEHDTSSVYTQKPSDPGAIYFTPENYPPGPGGSDCTAQLQQAIDDMEARGKFGIVFIPEGRYTLRNTVYVWKGIRLIGYGKNRPVFVLKDKTPGFQDSTRYMIHFTSNKPREGQPIRDANPGTFYSALSNIDFEIQRENNGAICIRSHYAQHCFISHATFRIGSGKAAIEKVGNEIENCRFIGGEYGIITTKPSPSWPFLMIDSYFEGQRTAAIRTEEAGLTLVRIHFKDQQTAISINPGRAEELFLTDSKLENVTGPALIISDEYNARAQINLLNVGCMNVPEVARFRKSGKVIHGPSSTYLIEEFSHGNQISGLNDTPQIATTLKATPVQSAPELPESDIPPLPDMKAWVNIRDLGAKGDDVTDDTDIILKGIENHPVLYFPTGRYVVSRSLVLKPNTVLIGLNPITTQLVLKDETAPFNNGGGPLPLLEAPKGGKNIVNGLGLDAGAINANAVATKWMAGADSYMNDVKFLGGHGTYDTVGNYLKIYNNNRTADADPKRKWDSQYSSLWITDGGGGTFKDIWTASPFAHAGIYVSDTDTEGRIYCSSIEHHVRNEVIIRNASNWKFYNFQFEEESGEGWNALPLRIENSSNLRFANVYLYRVIRQVSSYPNGIVIQNSRDLDFRGIHVYGPTKFSYDNTLLDLSTGKEIRSREISKLTISGNDPAPGSSASEQFQLLVSGFDFADGACLDQKGNLYFVDGRWHAVFKWDRLKQELSLILDAPTSPQALAFDQSGNLLIISNRAWREYSVYTCDPERCLESLTEIEATQVDRFEEKEIVYPGHLWRDDHVFEETVMQDFKYYYESPDGTTLIAKQEDLGRVYSLVKGKVGSAVFIADEFGQKTYRFTINDQGNLNSPVLIAEEGELDVATDTRGLVYIPAGHIFVYDQAGKYLKTLETPERPANVEIDRENHVLYCIGRDGVYSIRLEN